MQITLKDILGAVMTVVIFAAFMFLVVFTL